MRKVPALFLMGALILGCTGCSNTFNKSDIDTYLKTELGLSDYKIHTEPSKIRGDDGCIDYEWYVDLTDGSGIILTITDNYYKAGETTEHSLKDNYNEEITKYLFEQYDNCKMLKYDEESKTLLAKFKNKTQLDACLQELTGFLNFKSEFGYNGPITVKYTSKNPINSKLNLNIDNFSHITTYESDNDLINGEVYREYLIYCCTYGLKGRLEEFKNSGITSYVDSNAITINGKTYGNICGINGMTSITSLYNILKEEKITVDGDRYDFKFTMHDIEYQYSYGLDGFYLKADNKVEYTNDNYLISVKSIEELFIK